MSEIWWLKILRQKNIDVYKKEGKSILKRQFTDVTDDKNEQNVLYDVSISRLVNEEMDKPLGGYVIPTDNDNVVWPGRHSPRHKNLTAQRESQCIDFCKTWNS